RKNRRKTGFTRPSTFWAHSTMNLNAGLRFVRADEQRRPSDHVTRILRNGESPYAGNPVILDKLVQPLRDQDEPIGAKQEIILRFYLDTPVDSTLQRRFFIDLPTERTLEVDVLLPKLDPILGTVENPIDVPLVFGH